MGKFINSTPLTETLSLAEYSDGFYLYDKTRITAKLKKLLEN